METKICSHKYWMSSIQWQDAVSKFLIPLNSNCFNNVGVSISFGNNDFYSFHIIEYSKGCYCNYDSVYLPYFTFCSYTPVDFKIQGDTKFSLLQIKPTVFPNFGDSAVPLNLRVASFKHSTNWRAFASSRQEYWSKRPSQLKNTISRKRKKCLSAQYEFKFYTQLTESLRSDYWQIYQNSWKPAEASPEFINWLLDYCSSHSLLRLGIVYDQERPVAFQFWIVQHGTASIFKLAQDKAFDALSPGTVLMAEMVDWVYANDEIHCIDFLTGDDDYKKLWMDESRPLYGLEIFNVATIRGRFLWYRHCIKTLIKKWLGRA